MLAINHEPIAPDQLHHCAIRFCQTPEKPVPVLYFQGKRVTQTWRIELIAEVVEDELGTSGNTA